MKIQFTSIKPVLAIILFMGVAGETVQAESLWTRQSGPERGMVSDPRAAAIGDILTVVVQETSTQNATARTQTETQSSMNAAINRFLFSPSASSFGTHNGELPSLDMGGGTSYSGTGEVANRQVATARVAVTVIDVLPNGNLVIEGVREVSFARETQYAILRGVVRQQDIAPGNTILSSNIADAAVQFLSQGDMTDSQRKGWLTRFFDVVNPF